MEVNIHDFVKLFSDQFDDTPVESFSPDLAFRDLDEWSSLTALSVIAMVDDEYDVQLKGEDIRNVHTISDLFETVRGKLTNS